MGGEHERGRQRGFHNSRGVQRQIRAWSGWMGHQGASDRCEISCDTAGCDSYVRPVWFPRKIKIARMKRAHGCGDFKFSTRSAANVHVLDNQKNKFQFQTSESVTRSKPR